MRGVLIWLSGALLAFFATAGAFVLLANLSGSFSVRSVEPQPARPSNSVSPLRLEFDEARLDQLQQGSGQVLPLRVKNTSESEFSNVNLTMRVTSENTAQPGDRYYRATMKELATGTSKTVRFTLDLSSSGPSGRPATSNDSPEPRTILEVQATTPEGISALKTVVLPP